MVKPALVLLTLMLAACADDRREITKTAPVNQVRPQFCVGPLDAPGAGLCAYFTPDSVTSKYKLADCVRLTVRPPKDDGVPAFVRISREGPSGC